MATSGSSSVSVTNYDTLKFIWNATSQSIANNTTTIEWKLQLVAGAYGRINSAGTKAWSVTIDGTTYSGSASVAISNNTTKQLATGTATIQHNSDGSKTFSYSFSQSFSGITFSGVALGTVSRSATGTLDTIPRTSSVSATAANIGEKTTITINRATSAFTHTLTYAFGGLTGTIATKTTSTSISWTVPTTFYAKIPNAKYGTCTITCETFSGDTSIGTSTATFRATAAESACKPTLSPTVYIPDTAASYQLTGSTARFIQYYSWPSYTSGATVKNGATIKSLKVTNGNYSATDIDGRINAPVTTDTVNFTLTDSRGYTTTKDVKITLVNYVKLTCNLSASAPTPTGDMSFTIKGNYFNGSFGAVNNTLSVYYRYKSEGGSYTAWTGISATVSGNSYTASGKLTGLDYQSSYTIQAMAADELHNNTIEPWITSPAKVVKTTPIFDWGESDFNFNVSVTVNSGDVGYIHRNSVTGNSISFGVGGNDGITRGIWDGNYGKWLLSTDGTSTQIADAENTYTVGKNKVLWSGAQWMMEAHTVNLSEAVSKQMTGIVLVFSRYDTSASTTLDDNFNYHFVPKQIVALQNNKGSVFNMTASNENCTATKYLYISDTSIRGHANNTASGTGNTGVKYENARFVLRYVIGV